MSIDLFFEAAKFAAHQHKDQRRGGNGHQPYISHTLDVARRVAHFGFSDPETWAAAVLHDVVEDTYGDMWSGLADLNQRFGGRVAQLVEWLTLPPDCREDYVKKVNHQIGMMHVMSDEGRAIKIADKTSNVHDLIEDPPTTWSKKLIMSYASDSRDVVLAATKVSKDHRVHSMAEVFHDDFLDLERRHQKT